ncbi:BREX-2 system phosphatase PglZ [Actinomadura hibisca]|uniref:BREX-2 system phosphatase PglZ n=1 Tax=Actinomadura hibisca TaxID=68565 RepID=UPI0008307D06|nr:BREX-2 system phosphatase PglZ [Actinomadura hibisca]
MAVSTIDTPRTGAMRLSVATVTQYLAARKNLTVQEKRRIVLLRSVPDWDGPPELSWGTGQQARVVAAPSPLAVHELVLDHLAPAAQGPAMLVVLTDREENELDPAILSRAHRKRVETVDSWGVVGEAFGAEQVDSRLRETGWAAEALLDATPPGGWPRLAGGMLSRRTALSSLALRRLRLGRYDTDDSDPGTGEPGGDGLDTHTLLRWSLAAGGPGRLRGLRGPEREGLISFLSEEEQAGTAGRILFALVEAEHGSDAVPFGLLCAALWLDAPDDVSVYQARGRVERWLGDSPPVTGETLDLFLDRFGRSCQEFVTALLAVGRADEKGDRGRAARRVTDTILGRASELARQFGIEQQVRHSSVLPAGLAERFTAMGNALAAEKPDGILACLRTLEAHELAAVRDARVRIERAQMAARLNRWLAIEPATDVPTVAAAIDRHMAETGWADQALDHIEAGGDPDPVLKGAYDRIAERVRERRKQIDRSFARILAGWTAAGTDPGSMLTAETFLPRVVKPIATGKPGRRVLLLVLDGLSAAIAAELAGELRRNWAEFDPVSDSAGAPPRRRAMAAALPTLTAVSRTSLLTAALMKGGQADEKRLFPQHKFWGGARATAFHKDDLRGETAGSPFGQALTDALDDDTAHVAVVLNTIDDRLAKEQKLGDATWRLDDVGKLRELLREAAHREMAVLVTSDHGHVVDRHGFKVAGENVASARHRLPGGSAVDPETEIELSGPRVVADAPGGRIVALWNRDARYTAQKAGYHGGAALAEFAIPVLAFLPFNAQPPKGWRELGDPRPFWWRLEEEQPLVVTSTAPVTATRAPSPPVEVTSSSEALFDLEPRRLEAPQAAPEMEPVEIPLATALLGSVIFGDQVRLLARKPPMDKVEAAVQALLESGTLPVTALAQRVGYPITRADGFAAVLGQLLNYDGVQVLETLPDGRTLRLNIALLRDQFGLS